MNEVFYPRLVLVDADEPVKNVIDTGGIPGPEIRMLVLCGSMRGLYDIKDIRVQLDFGKSLAPTVRLLLKSV